MTAAETEDETRRMLPRVRWRALWIDDASDDRLPKPEVKTDVFVNRERAERRRRSNERE